MNNELARITEKIKDRSAVSREKYMLHVDSLAGKGKGRRNLSCGNLAHTVATCNQVERSSVLDLTSSNIGIVSSYNDMLSAHAPYKNYPDIIKKELRGFGHTAQVAGCVPAMCDGITQGQAGMEMSLFSRDLIAQATALSLSHNAFDGVLLLGICDKIAPGMLIGALSFGHLPCAFVPAGPMSTGVGNEEKVKIRQKYARGEASRSDLLEMECKSYHGEGTCTFFGTANTNQLVFEAMGLMLPGSAFVSPWAPLREVLTKECAIRVSSISTDPSGRRRIAKLINEKSIVNGIVALLASGGSTNHTMHLVAVARAAGIIITWDDIDAISRIVPLVAKIYPNGSSDINAFHDAGGVPCLLSQLALRGLLHMDIDTIYGCMADAIMQPKLSDGKLLYTRDLGSKDLSVIAGVGDSFSSQGGIKVMNGNIGRGVVKASAIAENCWEVTAPARIFDSQDDVEKAYFSNEFTEDVVIIVRFNGPSANGMPELHKLIPLLSNLMNSGLKVALVTDGRLSGASGKVPAIIHVSPEASRGGNIAKLKDGDVIKINISTGEFAVLSDLENRGLCPSPKLDYQGYGRELFQLFRDNVSSAESGASILFTNV